MKYWTNLHLVSIIEGNDKEEAGNEKNIWGRLAQYVSMCKLSIPEHNKHLAATRVPGGGREGGGATEVIYFSPLSFEKLNCNFLRSVLLWSNEAFKLVDGVKLIFKIIVGSKDRQERWEGQDNKIWLLSSLFISRISSWSQP